MSAARIAISVWTVDASVALKWLLPDEEEEAALDLLAAFRADRVQLSAPAFVRYEVANAMVKAFRRGRIEETAIAEGLQSFLALGLHDATDGDDLVLRALEISRQTGMAPYDATYVAHAEFSGGGVISNDKGMLSRAEAFPVMVVSLADLRL